MVLNPVPHSQPFFMGLREVPCPWMKMVEQTIRLVGNTSASISNLRRQRILKEIYPSLQDLAEEDLFKSAASFLFGEGFESKMKDRAKSVKLLAASKHLVAQFPNTRGFFRMAIPLSLQEEMANQFMVADNSQSQRSARNSTNRPKREQTGQSLYCCSNVYCYSESYNKTFIGLKGVHL